MDNNININSSSKSSSKQSNNTKISILAMNDKITELETKLSSLEFEKEIESQIQYISEMNEDLNLKLNNINNKEDNSIIENYNKELKSNNEECLNIYGELKLKYENFIKELNSIKERLHTLEIKIPPNPHHHQDDINIENENEPCVIITINNEKNIDMFKSCYNKRKEIWDMIESNKKDNEYKIFDIAWFSRNITNILEKCQKLRFVNINVIEINENIEITDNIIIDARPSTNLDFKNNSTLIINKANVNMDNISIIKCNYGENYLIDIKYDSTLELNDGFIESNSGNQSIFHVNTNSTLYLNRMVFKKNIQYKEKIPCCIKSEEQGNISINKCQFLDHSILFYRYSGYLIESSGDIEIISSKFDNNRPIISNRPIIKDYIRTIKGNGYNGKVIIDNITFSYCTGMEFRNYSSIIIKNSHFHDNYSAENGGGCLYIWDIRNINITDYDVIGQRESVVDSDYIKGEKLIKNCLFQRNSIKGSGLLSYSGSGGGAISIDGATDFKILDSEFNLNKSISGNGGAIYACNGASFICCACSFEENTAKANGGAIFVEHGSKFSEPSPNSFISNKASKNNNIAC